MRPAKAISAIPLEPCRRRRRLGRTNHRRMKSRAVAHIAWPHNARLTCVAASP